MIFSMESSQASKIDIAVIEIGLRFYDDNKIQFDTVDVELKLSSAYFSNQLIIGLIKILVQLLSDGRTNFVIVVSRRKYI